MISAFRMDILKVYVQIQNKKKCVSNMDRYQEGQNSSLEH